MSDREHDTAWNDRLQDWLDGDVDAQEQALIESHLQSCDRCQQAFDALQALDNQLATTISLTQLDHSFDARLLAQSGAMNDAERVAARERAHAQLQADFEALSRNWKQTLLGLLPSILAGIAFTLALTLYFDTAQWLESFAADSAGEIAGVSSNLVHLLLTSAMGASIGYTIARWLSAEQS
jgi:anti-sigma factor RsiW